MAEIRRVTNLDTPELSYYTQRSETALLRANEPAPGFFVAESPNVIRRALKAGYEPISFLVEETDLEKDADLFENYPQVPVYAASGEVLAAIPGFQLTRGTRSLMRRRAFPDVKELCRNARRIAVLEEVMNPTNVGAIFRSAAALGVDAILLTQGCSDPLYRRAARVSMGTVFQLPWTWLPQENWTALLKQEGFLTAAMALSEDSVSLKDPRLAEAGRLAIVLGTEGDGLKQATIADCDYTVKIPMAHEVDSLNVAAASAVAFWQLCASEPGTL